MKKIIEWNKRLLRDNREHLPPGGVMLARRDAPEEWRSFHPSHGEEIEDLRSRLNEVLPEDFDYVHCLGDTEPDF
jgi:hypothetical protein